MASWRISLITLANKNSSSEEQAVAIILADCLHGLVVSQLLPTYSPSAGRETGTISRGRKPIAQGHNYRT